MRTPIAVSNEVALSASSQSRRDLPHDDMGCTRIVGRVSHTLSKMAFVCYILASVCDKRRIRVISCSSLISVSA